MPAMPPPTTATSTSGSTSVSRYAGAGQSVSQYAAGAGSVTSMRLCILSPGVDRSSGTGTGQSFQGTAGSAWHARSTGFCQPVLLIYPPDVNFNNPGWRYCPGTPPQTRG